MISQMTHSIQEHEQMKKFMKGVISLRNVKILILILVLFSVVSCKTCRCPAYSSNFSSKDNHNQKMFTHLQKDFE